MRWPKSVSVSAYNRQTGTLILRRRRTLLSSWKCVNNHSCGYFLRTIQVPDLYKRRLNVGEVFSMWEVRG